MKKQYHYTYSWCKDCRKPISYYSIRCHKCNGLSKRGRPISELRKRVLCVLVESGEFSYEELGTYFKRSRQDIHELYRRYKKHDKQNK